MPLKAVVLRPFSFVKHMKNFSLRYLAIIILMLAAIAGTTAAQSRKARSQTKGDRLFTGLATSRDLPAVFGDDGVLVSTTHADGKEGFAPEIVRILKLGPKAIPLLIAHLDDMRQTRMIHCCFTQYSGSYPATVGDISLDLLGAIIRHQRPMFDMKCEKEAEGEGGVAACVERPYDTTLPDFYSQRKIRMPPKRVKRAKLNWQKAYRAKRIQYAKLKIGGVLEITN